MIQLCRRTYHLRAAVNVEREVEVMHNICFPCGDVLVLEMRYRAVSDAERLFGALIVRIGGSVFGNIDDLSPLDIHIDGCAELLGVNLRNERLYRRSAAEVFGLVWAPLYIRTQSESEARRATRRVEKYAHHYLSTAFGPSLDQVRMIGVEGDSGFRLLVSTGLAHDIRCKDVILERREWRRALQEIVEWYENIRSSRSSQ